MKRLTLTTLALIATLAIAIPASAQEEKKASLEITKATPVADIIKAMTQEEGLKVTGLDLLTQDMTYQGDLEVRPVTSIVSQLVKPFGFETVLDDTTINIRKVGTTPAPTTQPAMAPTKANRSAIQARVDDLSSRYPQAYNDDGTIGNFAQLNAMNRELFVQAEATRMATTSYYPQYPQTESFFGSYGGYNNGYGSYGGYMNPFAIRDFGNQEKYGLLKIDGPDKFLKNVRVLIDDVDVAVASKSNNSWNSPIIVTAGNHVVEFVRESSTGIVAFRRNVAIQPLSITRNNPTRLRVSGNEFENARELYEYRQHRFVESIDGKIEPVVKPVIK